MMKLKTNDLTYNTFAAAASAIVALALVLAALDPAMGKKTCAFDLSETAFYCSPPKSVIPLPATGECHAQGLAITDKYVFATCVERGEKKALLYRYERPEGFPAAGSKLEAPKVLDLTRDSMYHPSGIDVDETGTLWVASAHYRPIGAKSEMMAIDPESLRVKSSFIVSDHLGAVAAMGDKIVAFNWDARQAYVLSRDGTVIDKAPSPSAIAYQDCVGYNEESIICSGPEKGDGKTVAAVDFLTFDPTYKKRWLFERKVTAYHLEVNLGREGFTKLDKDLVFLPEDFPKASLYVYPPESKCD